MNSNFPYVVLLLSGKRKSGKDYISSKLKELLEENCAVLHISAPLKRKYAEENNIEFKELLTDSSYKEKYREQMIHWSDEIRKNDPGYFCKAACEETIPKKIWIVSDIRRKNDIKWFEANFSKKVKKVRIFTSESIRKERGWKFTKGVDDVESECNLDDYSDWDLKVSNNNSEEFETGIRKIMNLIKTDIS